MTIPPARLSGSLVTTANYSREYAYYRSKLDGKGPGLIVEGYPGPDLLMMSATHRWSQPEVEFLQYSFTPIVGILDSYRMLQLGIV